MLLGVERAMLSCAVVLALFSNRCRVAEKQPAPRAVTSGVTAPSSTGGSDAGGSASSPGGAGRDGAVTAALPPAVLESIVGCWQLEDRERWTIERTGASGAQVVRTLLPHRESASPPDYAKRAALPAKIWTDTAKGTLGFSTAGAAHALLFTFTVQAQVLEGSWASSHAPGSDFHSLAGRVTLRRCAGNPGR